MSSFQNCTDNETPSRIDLRKLNCLHLDQIEISKIAF